ncbi:MAG: amidohydrolase [Oscillospiraceae bacterium]|nr:amidohydrolase [Oscillospiraceae bacterium]
MKTVYYNGKVYTGEEALQEAFLVEDGRFAAVGSDSEIRSLADVDTAFVDLMGSFVCPGFNDSHMHLLNLGQSLNAAQLAPHTGSLTDLLAYVREYAQAHPPREGRWLLGRGWNQDYFSDASRMPSRADLDAISTEYPIMLTRACGHCCVVNSRVLEIAGITAATPSPAGGTVGQENGEPDGRLYDNAMDLLTPFIPLPDKEELKDMIRLACAALNSYGVTSSQTDDYCVFRAIPFETVNAAYLELEESGELTVRVYEQANFTTLPELRRFVEAGNVTGAGSQRFRIGPLKMLGDGALGSHTAHLSRPYADMPETCGFSLFSAEHMNEMVSYANRHGMQVAIHAIGDACLDQVLNAVEQALRAYSRIDHRHGVVHCQISRAEQLERIRALNMRVYAQSIFLDYDNHIVLDRVGPELAATSYCWKTLMDSGVSVSNGSDCPVELPDVMRGMECAVTRTSIDGTGPYLPEEAFTVGEALDSFTIRGAEASFEENVKGRIAPGYYADFVLLSSNPFETAPHDLHTIGVQASYLDGKCVYTA